MRRFIALELLSSCAEIFFDDTESVTFLRLYRGKLSFTTQVPAAVAGSLIFAVISRTGFFSPPDEQIVFENDPVK